MKKFIVEVPVEYQVVDIKECLFSEVNLNITTKATVKEYKEPSCKCNKNPELKVGERWYIKHEHSQTVHPIEISDLTVKTVQYRDGAFSYRYKKSDIEWIERVE